MSDSRYCRSPHVLWRRSLDAVVLLPLGPALDDRALAGGEPLAIGGSGPAVWALLTEARTADEMAARLAANHGADPVVVAADLAP